MPTKMLSKILNPKMMASSLVIWMTIGQPCQLYAQNNQQNNQNGLSLLPRYQKQSVFALRYDHDRPRSDIFAPIVSFVLPGYGQWVEGQYLGASIYSGLALGSYAYLINQSLTHRHTFEANTTDDSQQEDDEDDIAAKDNVRRKVMYGSQIVQTLGGFSAYHDFRTAVRSRQPYGQYEFLKHEETPGDILLAPLQFKYLGRASTLIPLSIAAAMAYFSVSSVKDSDDYERDTFSSADAFFATGTSWNAGTHEEVVFRGWIMPVMYEYWRSEFWSNAAQATLFAAAHLLTNPSPLPQLLLGAHLGYVTQKDEWRLAESVFIHTWWDIIVFSAAYMVREKAPEELKHKIKPILMLPPLQWSF